jgi:hypothetical protein
VNPFFPLKCDMFRCLRKILLLNMAW